MHLTKSRVHRKLGLAVFFLALIVLGVVLIHLYPSSTYFGFVMEIDRYCFILFLYGDVIVFFATGRHPVGGFDFRLRKEYEGFPVALKGDVLLGLPVEFYALIAILGILTFFRVWQLLFHPKRDEFIAD